MSGRAGGGSPPEFERLEQLPAVGGLRTPVKPPAPVTSAAGSEDLEELPAAPNTGTSLRSERPAASERNRPSAYVSVHSMRELLDLVSNDLPAVAVEGGVYRVQPHAYGGTPGRDPGLRRLAAAVIGGKTEDRRPAHDEVAARRHDGEPLPVMAYGIDLDAFRAGTVDDDAAKILGEALDRLRRRVDAIGAALLVRDRSGGYRSRQVTGLLRRWAAPLAFAVDDPVAARYLARRVALIAADPLHMIPGLEGRFPTAARERIGRLALLPARADGEPAYLLLAATADAGAWDVHSLIRRLGLVRATGADDPPSLS